MTELVNPETGEIVNGGAAVAIRDPRPIVRPAAALAELEAAMGEYQDVCKRLLDESDYQPISGKKFRKRSGWRKLGVAFGIDYELVEKKIARDENERVTSAEFVIRAIAPNGRRVDAWGACDSKERCCAPGCSKRHTHCSDRDKPGTCPGWTHFSHANHDIPATAETRAKNALRPTCSGWGRSAPRRSSTAVATAPPRPTPTNRRAKPSRGRSAASSATSGRSRARRSRTPTGTATSSTPSTTGYSKDVDALTKDEASRLIEAMDAHLKQLQGGETPAQPTLTEDEQIPF